MDSEEDQQMDSTMFVDDIKNSNNFENMDETTTARPSTQDRIREIHRCLLDPSECAQF